MDEDEKRLEIPDKFRASTDEYDEAAFARLQANDIAQEEYKAKVNAPFVSHTPKERERVNAGILITTLEPLQELTFDQAAQLAEAYATIGDYELAAETTPDGMQAAEYIRYREAVWRDEGEWCDHPATHQFIKDNVWSLKESAEVTLLACNVCGFLNVAKAPDFLRQKQAVRSTVRSIARPPKMSIDQARKWHDANVKHLR